MAPAQPMTADDLRQWHVDQAHTYDSAAAALGMSRSAYALMLAGQSGIDRRTALACAALAAGLGPWEYQGGAEVGQSL